MISLKGTSASAGCALASAMKIDIVEEFSENLMITFDEKVEEEEKLKAAIEELDKKLDKKINFLNSNGRSDEAKYLIVQKYILNNKILEEWAYEFIEYEYSAVSAIARATKKQVDFIKTLDSGNIEKRIPDIIEVGKRLMYLLSGLNYPDISHIEEDVILVAEDIPTTMMRSVDHSHVKGIVLSKGSTKSHTTLLSVDMEIPAIIGCDGINEMIKNGDQIFVDGTKGTVDIGLTEADVFECLEKISIYEKEKSDIKEFANMPTITKDGKTIHLFGNVIDINTSARYRTVGAEGIGLFRTDFLYTEYEELPTEDFQFDIYKLIAERNKKTSVVIRTMDTGDDKSHTNLNLTHERNPFLGYRAIRIALGNPSILLTQTKAILRASAYGNIKILYPLISNVTDIKGALKILEKAKDELRAEQIPFDENIKVGIVIEVPSAAIMIESLLKYVDFIAISVNSLTQYILAVDRLNPIVAHRFNSLEPALLKTIKYINDAAKKANKFCYIYGEIAANQKNVYIFIGLGITSFSVNPTHVLPIRKFINSIDFESAKEDAEKALKCESLKEVYELLKSKSI